jgi:hypothetical protein
MASFPSYLPTQCQILSVFDNIQVLSAIEHQCIKHSLHSRVASSWIGIKVSFPVKANKTFRKIHSRSTTSTSLAQGNCHQSAPKSFSPIKDEENIQKDWFKQNNIKKWHTSDCWSLLLVYNSRRSCNMSTLTHHHRHLVCVQTRTIFVKESRPGSFLAYFAINFEY